MRRAVDDCISQGILADFLSKHKSEVFDVCLTEFDKKKYADSLYESGRIEGRIEGRAEGRSEGCFETLLALVHDGLIPISEAVKRSGMSEEDFTKIQSGGV